MKSSAFLNVALVMSLLSSAAFVAISPVAEARVKYRKTYVKRYNQGYDARRPVVTAAPTPVAAVPQFSAEATTLQAGTPVLVGYEGEKVYIAPNERRDFEFTLRQPVKNSQGRTLLPYGSVVSGHFEPAPGGTRFFTKSITINGRSYPLSAQSKVINDVKDPRETNTGAIAGDAAIGALGGVVLGGLTGDRVIATEEVIAGAVAGAAVGNVTAPQVVVLDANTDFPLTLDRDFQIL
ncbi:MAG: hypothetical protein WCA07_02610 [Gloeobacterales cyanobacterium]